MTLLSQDQSLLRLFALVPMLIFQGDSSDDSNLSLIQYIPCQLLTTAVTVVLVFPFKCASASGTHIIACLEFSISPKVADLLCGRRLLNFDVYKNNDRSFSLVSLTDR